MYWVYILINEEGNKTYVGITDNLKRRLYQHNSGYHFYTKRYKPWKIIYKHQFTKRTEARKRERYLKSAAGRNWMKKKLFS